MSVYLTLKFLHILLAIIAVGFNATYAIWLTRAERDPRVAEYVLRGVKLLDDRIANPAYFLLLVSGLSMVVVAGYPLTTFWISSAIVLWVLAIGLGLLVYTPTLRRQIQMVGTYGVGTPEYRRIALRGTISGIVTMVLVLAILVLMVFKPSFG